MTEKKKLSWRCKNIQQQRDKATIYNSREWKELRAAKLRANPLCEQCVADGEAKGIRGGYIRAASCVHHIHPIEDTKTYEEMRHWAFLWGNLQSLCRECHARIHNQVGYHRKENVKARREQSFERWKARMMTTQQPAAVVLLEGDSDSEIHLPSSLSRE